MVIAMKKTFLNRYHYFFDSNGNLNPRCDAEERKNFLELCNKIKPNASFGNIKQGFLNEENIFKLRWRVNA